MMMVERVPLQSRKPANFTALAETWLLQGVLLICVTRGYLPLFGNPNESIYSSGPGLMSGTSLFCLLTAAWLFTILLVLPRFRASTAFLFPHAALLSLPLLAVASSLWSTAPLTSFGNGFELILLTLVGIYIGTRYPIQQQMQLFMIAGTIAAVGSLLVVVVDPQVGFDQLGHTGAVQGIFSHKNTCGSFMLLLATPAFFLQRGTILSRLLVAGYGLLCALLVGLSQSRTSWILFLVLMMGVLGLKTLRTFKVRDGFAMAGILFGFVLLLGWYASTAMSSILDLLGKDATVSGRTAIWNSVLATISKRPLLGYGYLAFFSSDKAGRGDLAMSVGFIVNHPHNGFLSIWLDMGIAGLSLFGLMLYRALRAAGRSWRRNKDFDWYLCILVLVLLQNIDERGLAASNDISWLLFITACAGLTHAASKRGSDPSSVTSALASPSVLTSPNLGRISFA